MFRLYYSIEDVKNETMTEFGSLVEAEKEFYKKIKVEDVVKVQINRVSGIESKVLLYYYKSSQLV